MGVGSDLFLLHNHGKNLGGLRKSYTVVDLKKGFDRVVSKKFMEHITPVQRERRLALAGAFGRCYAVLGRCWVTSCGIGFDWMLWGKTLSGV